MQLVTSTLVTFSWWSISLHLDLFTSFSVCFLTPSSPFVQAFLGYTSRLYSYLQLLENRLFSEGLHVLGAAPNQGQMEAYLGAYFGEKLPQEMVEGVAAVAAEGGAGDGSSSIEAARMSLERAYGKVSFWGVVVSKHCLGERSESI